MTVWNPERDLALLLDALTEEVLGASDRELVWDDEAVAEMRRLIAAADAGVLVPPLSTFVGRGLRAFVVRNQ